MNDKQVFLMHALPGRPQYPQRAAFFKIKKGAGEAQRGQKDQQNSINTDFFFAPSVKKGRAFVENEKLSAQ